MLRDKYKDFIVYLVESNANQKTVKLLKEKITSV